VNEYMSKMPLARLHNKRCFEYLIPVEENGNCVIGVLEGLFTQSINRRKVSPNLEDICIYIRCLAELHPSNVAFLRQVLI